MGNIKINLNDKLLNLLTNFQIGIEYEMINSGRIKSLEF